MKFTKDNLQYSILMIGVVVCCVVMIIATPPTKSYEYKGIGNIPKYFNIYKGKFRICVYINSQENNKYTLNLYRENQNKYIKDIKVHNNECIVYKFKRGIRSYGYIQIAGLSPNTKWSVIFGRQ